MGQAAKHSTEFLTPLKQQLMFIQNSNIKIKHRTVRCLIGCINLRCRRTALNDNNILPCLVDYPRKREPFHDEEIKMCSPSAYVKKRGTHIFVLLCKTFNDHKQLTRNIKFHFIRVFKRISDCSLRVRLESTVDIRRNL